MGVIATNLDSVAGHGVLNKVDTCSGLDVLVGGLHGGLLPGILTADIFEEAGVETN